MSHDAERDVLAIAKFLVLERCHPILLRVQQASRWYFYPGIDGNGM